MAFTPDEHPRAATGEFTEKHQSAPETRLHVEPPLTESIASYLVEYTAAEQAYAEASDGEDADHAYEAWEDFQTDNSGNAYAMLESAKAEIERLQAELAAAQTRYAIPEDLRAVIDEDFGADEPLLYVPETGHSDGYFDVIAVVDGETARKYTQNLDGEVDWGRV